MSTSLDFDRDSSPVDESTPSEENSQVANVAAEGAGPAPNPNRWRLLAVLATVQFIIFLDATIVNVALPSIQRDLSFSNQGLTWVVNGYLLAAGGLLLLGGRLGDVFGRRRMFVTGSVLFAVASTIAALSTNAQLLMGARFLQGVAEACAAPAALGMIALAFTDMKEMQKAFAIWGGLSGVGSTLGVILSGILTDTVSWRLIFWINVPLALIPAVLVFRYVKENKMQGGRVGGPVSAVLITAGMIATIQGVLQLSSHGLVSTQVLVPLVAGVAALIVFFTVQARSSNPLFPLGFLRDRVRATGYAGLAFLNASTAAMFFLLVLYMQDALGYSPLENGLAWIPYCVLFMVGLKVSLSVMPKYGTKPVVSAGLAIAGLGLGLLATIPSTGGTFAVSLLPGMLIVAFGGGLAFPAIQTSAMSSVSMQDAGLGSGVVTTVGQVGQALGLAVITTIALKYASHGQGVTTGSVHGFRVGLAVAAGCLLVGAVLAPVISGRTKPTSDSSAADESVDAS